jgi:hypothetical protein
MPKHLLRQWYAGKSGTRITTKPNKIGYDNQDAFINGLLTNQPLPEATIEQQPEMVFYQQTAGKGDL